MSESAEITRAAFFSIRSRTEGGPQFGIDGEPQTVLHDADDRSRNRVNSDRLAKYARILSVPVLPHAIAQNGDGIPASRFISGSKIAADHRLLPNHGKRVRRDFGNIAPARHAAFIGDILGVEIVRTD